MLQAPEQHDNLFQPGWTRFWSRRLQTIDKDSRPDVNNLKNQAFKEWEELWDKREQLRFEYKNKV